MAHPTVSVEHPQSGAIDIDEDLAELLPLVWRAGVVTEQSCQEMNDGLVWLVLATVDDLLHLLAVVGVYDGEPDSLFERLAAHEIAARDSSAPEDAGCWRYRLNPYPLLNEADWDDEAGEPTVPTGLGRVPWETNVTVEFPRVDIAPLTALLNEYMDSAW